MQAVEQSFNCVKVCETALGSPSEEDKIQHVSLLDFEIILQLQAMIPPHDSCKCTSGSMADANVHASMPSLGIQVAKSTTHLCHQSSEDGLEGTDCSWPDLADPQEALCQAAWPET